MSRSLEVLAKIEGIELQDAFKRADNIIESLAKAFCDHLELDIEEFKETNEHTGEVFYQGFNKKTVTLDERSFLEMSIDNHLFNSGEEDLSLEIKISQFDGAEYEMSSSKKEIAQFFLRRLHNGVLYARVNDQEIDPGSSLEQFQKFTIELKDRFLPERDNIKQFIGKMVGFQFKEIIRQSGATPAGDKTVRLAFGDESSVRAALGVDRVRKIEETKKPDAGVKASQASIALLALEAEQ